MNRQKMFLGVLLLVVSGIVVADTYVRGYYGKDGTYVQPHYRSSADSSYNNNWSVRPNVNPYTGRRGTRQPTWNDRPPSNNGYGYRYNNRKSNRNYRRY